MDSITLMQFAYGNGERFLAEMIDLANISSRAEHKPGVSGCSEFLRDRKLEIGLERAESFGTGIKL